MCVCRCDVPDKVQVQLGNSHAPCLQCMCGAALLIDTLQEGRDVGPGGGGGGGVSRGYQPSSCPNATAGVTHSCDLGCRVRNTSVI